MGSCVDRVPAHPAQKGVRLPEPCSDPGGRGPALFDDIALVDNRQRLHGALGYRPSQEAALAVLTA